MNQQMWSTELHHQLATMSQIMRDVSRFITGNSGPSGCDIKHEVYFFIRLSELHMSYPGLQLRWELGLELAHGAISVIPLNENFGRNGCLLSHVLQAVSLWKQEITIDAWQKLIQ